MPKIMQLPSGSWHTKVYDYTDTDGKRHYEPFTDPDKKVVKYLSAQFALNKKRMKRPSDWTVGEAIDKYIESKDGILSPPTISGYKKIRRNNMQGIMSVALRNVTQELIQKEVNQESKKISPRTGKPLSAKTIANANGLISSALAAYYPDLRLNTTLPAREKKIIELPPAEMIMDAVIGTKIELPCMLAMWLSYSMSEIRGIRVSAISADGCITIREVIVDVDGKAVAKSKTKAYERTRKTKIPPYILRLIESQDTYKNAISTGVDDYLIKLDGKGIYNRFSTLLRNANIPHITFHNLRHINASIMLELGIPDKYAMERGGWATPHTLKKVYQHTFSTERKIVDSKIDDYFDNIITNANKKPL